MARRKKKVALLATTALCLCKAIFHSNNNAECYFYYMHRLTHIHRERDAKMLKIGKNKFWGP